ncbi:MAG: DUF4333 domain-containing protein [Actinomycetota bacterium]|nr:DUF4333 domain-containing protein [Actinomycetota bacterium]
MKRTISLVLLGSSVVLAGCGTKTINQQSEVKLVGLGLAKANLGAPTSVDCPSGVQAKVGKTFDCHAVLANGKKATFTLKVDGIEGNNGHMTIVAARQG